MAPTIKDIMRSEVERVGSEIDGISAVKSMGYGAVKSMEYREIVMGYYKIKQH